MATQVVTGETRKEFMAARMQVPLPMAEDKPQEPEKQAENEPKSDDHGETEKVEAKKSEHEERPTEVKEGERIRLKMERQKARDEANQLREELAKARAELESAKRPVQQDDGKPDPAKFTDMATYAEALADWKLDQKWRAKEQAEAEARAKVEAERVVKRWQAQVKETAAALPDYQEVVADANIPLTNELRDAILESEIGPRIQYYLAKNPDEVDRLTGMTVRGMQREVGKLEAKIEAQMAKQQTPAEAGLPKVPVPQRARASAPEPITPIVSPGSPANGAVVDAEGNVVGDYASYKAARRAGKIR